PADTLRCRGWCARPSRCPRRRSGTPASAAPAGVSRCAGCDRDYLLEGATDEAAKARFEDRELLRQFQEVELLPDEDKDVIKKLLDAFLTKKQLQVLAK
ncbi:hypothetical protein ACLEDO_17050, partial [Lonsdalea quercina]